MDIDDRGVDTVARRLGKGRLIPFLGAGASLAERPEAAVWQTGCGFLPTGTELAAHLSEFFEMDPGGNLLRVAQQIAWSAGREALHDELREVFVQEYSPTLLHRVLARATKTLAEESDIMVVIMTTNYDDLAEQAFRDEELEFDLLWYSCMPPSTFAPDGSNVLPWSPGFMHQAPGGRPLYVEKPSSYELREPGSLRRPVIVKLHGSCNREGLADDDSYVITEDDYIDYLVGVTPSQRLPIEVLRVFRDAALLFLGYSLIDDWDTRATLKALGTDKPMWSVLREPTDPVRKQQDVHMWDSHLIAPVYCELSDYAKLLEEKLNERGWAASV